MRSLIFCVGLFFAGCATVPKHDLAGISTPPSLSSSVDAALETGEFIPGHWPEANWWEMFHDDQLSQLVLRAISHNPTLQKAIDKVEVAKALAKRERAALFPHLRSEGDIDWQYFSANGFERTFFPTPPGAPPIPASTNQIDLSLNFTYELDFWGKNRKKFQAAVDAARAERADADQARLLISTLVAQSYFDLQTQYAKRHVLQEVLENQAEIATLSASRADSGIDNRLEVLTANNQVLQAEKALVAIDKGVELSLHLLNVLCGDGPDTVLELEERTIVLDEALALPEHLEADLLSRRPDLMAQIWRVEAAAKEIGVAQAEFYPNVDLTAFMGLESLTFNKFFLWASKMGALNPAFHLPIFIGGKLKAHLRSKVSLFNEAVHDYNQLLLSCCQEVADNLTILCSLSQELSLQGRSVETLEERYLLSFLRFETGIANFLNVIEAQESVLREELTQIDLERNQLIATLQLIKALGGGYQSPLNPPYQKEETP